MVQALWELAPPIFLGVFLAIVAIALLLNMQGTLLRGPRLLANALFAPRHACKAGCGCGAAKGKGVSRVAPPTACRKERYGSCELQK